MIRLGEEIYTVASEELNTGAMEVGANNCGPWVEKYLSGMAESPSNWCMAFASWCTKEASIRLRVSMPFRYSLGAREAMNQFKSDHKFITIGSNELPKQGDLVFFWRESPTSWMGHVGIINYYTYDGTSDEFEMATIEGNVGSFPAHVKTKLYKDHISNAYSVHQILGFGSV